MSSMAYGAPPAGGADPSQLAALLGQLGGGAQGAQGAPDEPDSYGGGDPLQSLQQCIQDLHGLVATMPDAQHTQMVVQALGILAKIQSDIMSQKGGQ